MELIIGLIVIVIIIYFLFAVQRGKGASVKSTSIYREERILTENIGWLEERWNLAEKERKAGELKSVPYWFFDNVTERQLQRIKDIGLNIKSERPTKGEASDIIGLFEPVEDENEEILKYFKLSLKSMNQSRARYEVGKLFADSTNVQSWKNRRALPMQKEFYKYFHLDVPKDLTYEQASLLIADYSAKLSEEDEPQLDEWDAYENIYDEINDPDFREDYELKKISLSLYRTAIEQLKKEGKSLTQLNDNIDMVVNKIVELKQDIRKR